MSENEEQKAIPKGYSKSTLHGYRKPLPDDYGVLICHCTKPIINGLWPDGKRYCSRCFALWYN